MVTGEWSPCHWHVSFLCLTLYPYPAEEGQWGGGLVSTWWPAKVNPRIVKSPWFILRDVNNAREAVGFQEVLDYSVEAPPEFCFSMYYIYLHSYGFIVFAVLQPTFRSCYL